MDGGGAGRWSSGGSGTGAGGIGVGVGVAMGTPAGACSGGAAGLGTGAGADAACLGGRNDIINAFFPHGRRGTAKLLAAGLAPVLGADDGPACEAIPLGAGLAGVSGADSMPSGRGGSDGATDASRAGDLGMSIKGVINLNPRGNTALLAYQTTTGHA
jgi:hypothetical protein